MEAARPAGRDDAEALVALGAQAAAELSALRGGPLLVAAAGISHRLAPDWTDWIADSSRAIWVGTIDGAVVGYAIAREDVAARVAVLDELYVDLHARGVGVGAAMMDAVRRWGRRRGCIGLDTVVLPGSREAKNFFEQAGLKARLLVMHTGLEPPPDDECA